MKIDIKGWFLVISNLIIILLGLAISSDIKNSVEAEKILIGTVTFLTVFDILVYLSKKRKV